MATTEMVRISVVENARDSLGRMEKALHQALGSPAGGWKAALAWAWQAAGLLFLARLETHQDDFDEWVRDYFPEVSESVDPLRDSRFYQAPRVPILAILDILSPRDLESLIPEFYQGWQDRTARCAELRTKVGEILNGHLTSRQCEDLLVLAAVHSRTWEVAAPVQFNAVDITRRFESMLDMVGLLWDRAWPESGEFESLLRRCRVVLA